MKTAIYVLGLSLAASTSAFAASSALDVVDTPPAGYADSVRIDYTATAAIGQQASPEQGPRLGDGSPVYR